MNQFTARFMIDSKVFAEESFGLSPGQSLLVGNHKGQADLRISADSVSRKHLYIAMDGVGRLLVCDAGSSNGTFVGNRKLDSNTWHLLGANEKISLGREVICEVWEQDAITRQFSTPPQSLKKGKDEIENDDDDEKNDRRININFEPNIQVPSQSQPSEKNAVSLSGLIFAGALICAALTNPSKQDHMKAIEEKFPTNPSYIASANRNEYDNYVVLSFVKINPQLASIGLFKNIVFVNPENFNKTK
jgi:hypothetical protein